ncbi:MAG: hypothetical protein HOP29_04830 [Phycisphaerales bacterium]|nr:hypothetical protein [Phycisphaerales bacterium]
MGKNWMRATVALAVALLTTTTHAARNALLMTAEPIPPGMASIAIFHPNGPVSSGGGLSRGVPLVVYDSLVNSSGVFARPLLGRFFFDDIETTLDNVLGGIIHSYDVVVRSSITINTPGVNCTAIPPGEAAIPFDVTTTLWRDDQSPPDPHVTGMPLSPIAMSTCNFTGILKNMVVTLTCPMVGEVGLANGQFWVGTSYSSDCAGWAIAGLTNPYTGFSEDFFYRSDDAAGNGPYSAFFFGGCPPSSANCANFMIQIMGHVAPDSDGDGVADAIDPAPGNPFICGDFDLDTCDDCSVTGGPPDRDNDGLDTDGDGVCDNAECTCNVDVNGDLVVDTADVFILTECIRGLVVPGCDVNCNGRIDYCDLDAVQCAAAGGSNCCTTQDCGACCVNATTCFTASQQNCETAPPFGPGGVFQGTGSSCGKQNAVIIDEGGGIIFVHVIGPPTQCPWPIGPAPSAGCIPNQFIDAWTSPPDGQMCHNFGVTDSPPIPADFFGPGSDPFFGAVCFAGQPFGSTPFGEFGMADTLIRRTSDPFDRCALPSPDPVDVPIEIVALNLASVQPITVTFISDPPQMWNVHVGLSQVPSPQGQLTARKTHCNGGTYTSSLPVQPLFTFTRVDPPMNSLPLDTGLEGILPVLLQQSQPFPWVSDIDPNFGYDGDLCTDFHPGIEEPGASTDCDCQNNGLLDRCEIEGGLPDTNANGVPDECDPAACCLDDGGCIIASGLSCSGFPGTLYALGTFCDDVDCAALPCADDDDCDDDDACTYDDCPTFSCTNAAGAFGDVNGVGGVDIFDILCVLDGFAGDFDTCAKSNLDLAPCPLGDDMIDIFDILAVLDGFAGEQGCCAP